MPQKTLDMRMAYGKLLCQRQKISPQGVRIWLCTITVNLQFDN